MAGKFWTQSWNPVIGCYPVGDECDNCWAAKMVGRMEAAGVMPYYDMPCYKDGFVEDGKWTGHKIIGTLDWIDQPIRRHKPSVYSVAWLGDLFYDPTYIPETYDIMLQSPQHQFLVLTKRAEEMLKQIRKGGISYGPNVWHGVTVNRQKDIKERVEPLLEIPGKKWMCIEPLLEHVELSHHILQHIDWVVVGAETGPNARRGFNEWFWTIQSASETMNIPCWTKELPSGYGVPLHQAPQAIAEILKTDKKIMAEVGKIDTLEGS